MRWRRRTSRPVPLAPTHRRDWRTLWRRCICGLTSPCVDRLAPATPLPFPPRTATTTHPSAGSHEERSPRYPTLIEYLATVPFPVHFGVAVLRAFPTEPPDSPKPSLPRAPADHPGGSGALGGPGSRPCPGSRAGAAPTPPRALPDTAPFALPRAFPYAPVRGRTRRRPTPSATRQESEASRGDGCSNANPTNGGQAKTGKKRPRAGDEGRWRLQQSRERSRGPAGGGERAGERAGRPGARDLCAGTNGGRRGRLPDLGGRPAMAYHHVNLSRR